MHLDSVQHTRAPPYRLLPLFIPTSLLVCTVHIHHHLRYWNSPTCIKLLPNWRKHSLPQGSCSLICKCVTWQDCLEYQNQEHLCPTMWDGTITAEPGTFSQVKERTTNIKPSISHSCLFNAGLQWTETCLIMRTMPAEDLWEILCPQDGCKYWQAGDPFWRPALKPANLAFGSASHYRQKTGIKFFLLCSQDIWSTCKSVTQDRHHGPQLQGSHLTRDRTNGYELENAGPEVRLN